MDIVMNETCLISKEPIEHKITLPCDHSFEYYYLFHEIQEQKKRHLAYFKCPYCRKIYYSLIPYMEVEGVEKISHVNYYSRNIMPLFTCKQEDCQEPAHHFKTGISCRKHYTDPPRNKCMERCKNGNACRFYAIEGTTCAKHKGPLKDI